MIDEYIPFAEAQASQADALGRTAVLIGAEVAAAQRRGELNGDGPVFLGIGASLAAAAPAVWVLRTRGVHSWRLNAGEHPLPYPVSLHPLVGVSQSGKSTETLAVLNSVDERLRIAVVNVDPSPVSEAADTRFSLGNIPDSYASTIGYTATIMGLAMIAEGWNGGAVDPSWGRFHEVFRSFEETVKRFSAKVAPALSRAESVDCVGAGPSVGSAEAGSLLLREVARMHATGMSSRQYLHGAMESAGGGAHILFGDSRETEIAQTLARAGHQTLLVTTTDGAEEENLSVLRLPTLPAAQRAILEALVMQTISADTAAQRGLRPEDFVFHNSDTKVA